MSLGSGSSHHIILWCRGDVGSWVREAALQVMASTLRNPNILTSQAISDAPFSNVVLGVVQAALEQSVGRIARLREVGVVGSTILSETIIGQLVSIRLYHWSGRNLTRPYVDPFILVIRPSLNSHRSATLSTSCLVHVHHSGIYFTSVNECSLRSWRSRACSKLFRQ